ncbi:MAG: HAD-IIIA family hydrolase [bacterium]
MVIDKKILKKAKKIRLVLTDCDGVLTDAKVYYSIKGEELKSFSLRDGMGVERLRTLLQINTGIITGEENEIINRRAEKLNIDLLFCGIKDKLPILDTIAESLSVKLSEIAYMGDDVNDIAIMKQCGLKVCPCDAVEAVKNEVDYITENKGGNGAFRDLAELLIFSQTNIKKRGLKK